MDFLFKNSCWAKNVGLLILRLGIGYMFFYVHGYPKLMAGNEKWLWLGSQMSYLGITAAPLFWGFMAAAAECIGGVLLMIGFATRLSAGLMAFTMFVAAYMHIAKGDGVSGAAHAIELCIVFLSLLVSGAGKYSIDEFFSAE